ncbi:MAG: xylosidase/arabinosidase [Verrucomicrobiae bacterium]|nr:xylosidase/arabinosidase [Verrucomicrobiae bacterium]
MSAALRFIVPVLLAACLRVSGHELDGRVMCGYQGWFRCEGDGAGEGWRHYQAGGKFEPGQVNIEIWPDVGELAPEERCATKFRHADGRVAEVFSSVNEATVRRHFRWMREAGIDGVFLQRFAVEAVNAGVRDSLGRVLANVRAAARAEERNWCLMYDFSGMKPERMREIEDDWRTLHRDGPMKGEDLFYQGFRGKPLVSLWGLGFNDRPAALAEWERLIRFFRGEGCAVMLGVPCYWRTLDRDTIADPKLHELIALADIVSPWAVGRFGTPEQAAEREESVLKPDIAWCRDRKITYLPVVFPGFSWHNLQKSRGRDAPFDQIPRRGGEFLWSQAVAAKQAGSDAVYVAMFDEMDEGTAIFKTTQDPPVGASPFLREPGVSPDHYLRLTGRIGRLLRDEPVD